MNLIINAGEAIPPDTDGRIDVVTSAHEITRDVAREHSQAYDVAPGTYVCLEVRDNGAGMDSATRARMFDPFFSTKFTGRGLGLAAVHGIVRSIRGFIGVRSLPGEGTTIRMFLPASGKQRPEEHKHAPTPRQVLRPSTVLVTTKRCCGSWPA